MSFDPRHLEQLRALKGAPRVTFPGGDLTVKQVERVVIREKDLGFDPYLSDDGYTEAFADTKLVEQAVIEQDDRYYHLYQKWTTIPGVPTSNTSVGGEWRNQFAKDGETIQTTQPVGSDLSQLEDGEDVVIGTINQNDKNQGTITVTTAPGGFVPLEGASYGADSWGKYAKDGIITTTRTLVAHGSAPDTGETVITSEVTPQNDVDAIKTTRTTDTEFVALAHYDAMDGAALGGETVTSETPVLTEEATPPEGGFLVLDARQTSLNANQSVQIVKTLDGEEYPILYGSNIDEVSGVVINYNKTYVPNGTEGGIDENGFYVEIQPRDKWRSIQIASKVNLDTLPEPEVIPYFGSLSLPGTLLSVEIVWDVQKGGGAGVSSGQNSASASADARLAAVLVPKIQDGFNGVAKGTLTRSWHFSIPTVPTATKILPSTGIAKVITKYASYRVTNGAGGTSVGSGVGVRTMITKIGGVLTNGVTLSGDASKSDSVTWSANTGSPIVYGVSATGTCHGEASLELPPSTPTSLASGSKIIRAVSVVKQRFGIYVKEVIELEVP